MIYDSSQLRNALELSKLIIILSTYIESIFVVTPGTAFCSWIAVFIFIFEAALTSGQLT